MAGKSDQKKRERQKKAFFLFLLCLQPAYRKSGDNPINFFLQINQFSSTRSTFLISCHFFLQFDALFIADKIGVGYLGRIPFAGMLHLLQGFAG
jgi:hypothetical protein